MSRFTAIALIFIVSVMKSYAGQWKGNIYEEVFNDPSNFIDLYNVFFASGGGVYTTNDFGYILCGPVSIGPADRFLSVGLDIPPSNPPDVGPGYGYVDITLMDENKTPLAQINGISSSFSQIIDFIDADTIFVRLDIYKTNGNASCVIFRMSIQKETPFHLSQGTILPQPNPFYPSDGPVKLSFEIYEPLVVSVKIYDLEGNEIYSLMDEQQLYGDENGVVHSVYWDGTGYDGEVSTGTYLVYLKGVSLDGREVVSSVERVVLVR